MRVLMALFAAIALSLGFVSTASATDAKLEQSAEASADCGEVTLTFTNNHTHATNDFSYVWNIQTSDEQNYNVVVANSEGSKTEVVTLAEGEGTGWVSYGVVAGPESDYYLANETIAVDLCAPDPVDEEPVDEEPVDEEPTDEEPVDEEPTPSSGLDGKDNNDATNVGSNDKSDGGSVEKLPNTGPSTATSSLLGAGALFAFAMAVFGIRKHLIGA